MRRLIPALVLCLATNLAVAARADAQEPGATITGCKSDSLSSLSSVRIDANHSRLEGTQQRPVQVVCDDTQLFATQMDLFQTEGRLIAIGDVVFVSGNSRIAADRLEYDTKAKTGAFYNAWGTTTIRDKAQPQLEGSQEPNAFFWGEELHKTGPRTYKIIRGGFTACVQPTPRWDVASGEIQLKLDDYALLRNSVFRVKGVPLMYLPIFYYPMQEDDRATGFLMPIYGSSTQKGHQLSNQFFWAIGRSHDATFVHDWLSKAGQGYGGEYQYVLAPGSGGNARLYMLNEREVTPEEADGSRPPRPASRSFNITGGLTQALGGSWRAQASANYFTSLQTQQRYQQDVLQATTRHRTFGGALTGTLRDFVVSARVDQNDYFDSNDTLTRTGSLPRVSVSRGERAIGGLPIYFGAIGEVANIVRTAFQDDEEIPARDQGLVRLDLTPTVRVPFTKWAFFTVNSAVSWRGTYWTRSLNTAGQQIDESIGRQYFDLSARATGPVFMKIFDTPENGFATRWKHVVEPSLVVQRVTAIDNVDRIVKLESPDYTIGNVTSYTYGISNRLYAKKEVAREVASVTVQQRYYTDARAAAFDRNFESSYDPNVVRRTNFSPVSILARVSPTDRVQGQFRTEWDPTVHTLRTISANGSFGNGSWFDSSAGWSMRRLIPELPDFSNPATATHALNGSTTMRTRSNRLGGTYSFDYDFRRDYFLQQRIVGYYNAQCCGVALEWQTFNLTGLAGITVPQDRRFNISFTLAGIGTFSNFFGALSGQGQRR
jgi:LPS-assembly protein